MNDMMDNNMNQPKRGGVIIGVIIAIIVLGGIIFGLHQHNENKMMTATSMSKSMDSVMLSGDFAGQNKMTVKGHAEIENDKLMLTDFSSSKGPDLHVYLTKDGDVDNGYEVDKVDYTKASQTFTLTKSDLKQYNQVVIYCDKAHVTFGAADLN